MTRNDPRQLALFDLDAEPETHASSPVSSPATGAPPAPPAPRPTMSTNDEPTAERAPLPVTLADVLDRIGEMPASQRRSDLSSAIRGLASVIGRPLGSLPAAPAELASLLTSANPAAAGLTMGRWSRIRTHLRGALGYVGFEVMPGRDVKGLGPEWQLLVEKLPARRVQVGLSRLLSYFSRSDVTPLNVSRAHFDMFEEALKAHSLQAHPEAAFRTAVDAWNAAARLLDAWPQLPVERRPDPRRYARARGELPQAFMEDVDAYLGRKAVSDPFSKEYHRKLRPATIKGRRLHIMQIATALLASGYPEDQLTSLAVLVKPENAEAALRRLRSRHGEDARAQVGQQARTLVAVVKQWVKAPTEDVELLSQFARGLAVTHKGMAPKNVRRLRQFDLEANTNTLLLLPTKVMKQVAENECPDRHDARRVMLALAVEFLTVAPVRMMNLASLDLARHFLVVRRGKTKTIHVVFPAEEMKNGRELQVPLPASFANLLTIYLDKYRPLLADDSGTVVFPGRDGERRSPSALGNAISAFLRRETGLVVNPHLFRQWAAGVALRHTAGGLETARLMLGHASPDITLRYYAHVRTDEAFRKFEAIITGIRKGIDPLAAGVRGRSRGGS